MTIEELEQIAESVRAENAKFDHEINVCMGTGCLSQHSDQLKDALVKAVAAAGKNAFVRRTGCMGLCAAGPLVLVDPKRFFISTATPATRNSRRQPRWGACGRLQCDLREHFDQQVHVVLENSGHIDPEKIDDYIARDGYQALVKALTEMSPNEVIQQITESGLRGRGGGGYPTGLKWARCRKQAATSNTSSVTATRATRRIHGSQRSRERPAARP